MCRAALKFCPEFAALLLALIALHGGLHRRSGARRAALGAAGPDRSGAGAGLAPGTTLRRIVIPQAMRVIVPPLTSQYLNLIKNSSLAVAIGYPDLVQVFTGSVLFITGQAVEIVAVTMAVYLVISLVHLAADELVCAFDAHCGALSRWPCAAAKDVSACSAGSNGCRRR